MYVQGELWYAHKHTHTHTHTHTQTHLAHVPSHVHLTINQVVSESFIWNLPQFDRAILRARGYFIVVEWIPSHIQNKLLVTTHLGVVNVKPSYLYVCVRGGREREKEREREREKLERLVNTQVTSAQDVVTQWQYSMLNKPLKPQRSNTQPLYTVHHHSPHPLKHLLAGATSSTPVVLHTLTRHSTMEHCPQLPNKVIIMQRLPQHTM